jgi:hypothetical protein
MDKIEALIGKGQAFEVVARDEGVIERTLLSVCAGRTWL